MTVVSTPKPCALLGPDDLAVHPPDLGDLGGTYDWETQRLVTTDDLPVAYKMSTQTFDTRGQPKDSDKDYDK